MSICFAVQKAITLLSYVDPVALRLGVLEIRWYSLAYVFGALFTYWYIRTCGRGIMPDKEFCSSLVSYMVLGVVIGGRVGYVLFYNPGFYLEFPIEALKLWNGGMSFHGGLIGCMTFVIFLCRRNKVPVLSVCDLLGCSHALGLFLGRIANFVNGELYGRVTQTCIGVVFPSSGSPLPRHPSQLYEAILEGLLPLIFLNLLFFLTKIKTKAGALIGVALTWYGVVRCVGELFREPDIQLGYIALDLFTMGQILSAPLVPLGIFLLVKGYSRGGVNYASVNM